MKEKVTIEGVDTNDQQLMELLQNTSKYIDGRGAKVPFQRLDLRDSISVKHRC
jgi:hypothetical protein